MTDRPRVLILGGGFAALETAFLLRMRTQDACEITIVADRDRFVFRPNTIYIPFGADPKHFYVELPNPLERRGITLERGTVAGVEPQRKQVELEDGRGLTYDHDLPIGSPDRAGLRRSDASRRWAGEIKPARG